MSPRMIHPGPRGDQRVLARRARLIPVQGHLPQGATVLEGVSRIFADHGCKGGLIRLDGAVCDPLRYVLPALSTDGLHAAWYSDTQAPPGSWRIERATATVGQKDGLTFLHCHGIWRDGDARAMGHLLPMETRLARDVSVRGIGSAEAWFEALPDSETAFTLFTPQSANAGSTPQTAHAGASLLARLLPGEDVVTAIETLAARHQIRHARLHGVGSIDHLRFDDGRRVDCLATELHFNGAVLTDGIATIPIEVVDTAARIHHGRLARGNNAVGVTLELIIEHTGHST